MSRLTNREVTENEIHETIGHLKYLLLALVCERDDLKSTNEKLRAIVDAKSRWSGNLEGIAE